MQHKVAADSVGYILILAIPRFWISIGKQIFAECIRHIQGFPCDSDGKESACNAGYPGSISGSGRPPGEGNGNPLQYSCLENPMDGGAWWATWGHKKSDTTE